MQLLSKKILFSFATAFGTYAEKIKAICQNFKTAFFINFLHHFIQAIKIRVDYLPAFGAHYMGVRMRFAAVIVGAFSCETKLENLPQ